ncbi:unnamed protein product [Strongylus vulgaris]|uniref:Uncharacterized protein n=1 Tax=Strongylus vulgaris TaxID=40348 RepID=A0A3P7IYQ6_STRVU|nr:unnamed protein product [Strongylus vulgaris]
MSAQTSTRGGVRVGLIVLKPASWWKSLVMDDDKTKKPKATAPPPDNVAAGGGENAAGANGGLGEGNRNISSVSLGDSECFSV